MFARLLVFGSRTHLAFRLPLTRNAHNFHTRENFKSSNAGKHGSDQFTNTNSEWRGGNSGAERRGSKSGAEWKRPTFNRARPQNKKYERKDNFTGEKKPNHVGKRDARLWERQKEMASDLGVHLDSPNSFEALALEEDTEYLQDEIDADNFETNRGINSEIRRLQKKQRKQTLYKIMERKYFKKPQEVNLLTWDAKEQIRYLHQELPDEWTLEKIAESFPVTVEGARLLIRSSWRPHYIEEVIKHDKRVQRTWLQLKERGGPEGGPLNSRYQEMIREDKIELLKHSTGHPSLPKPQFAFLPSKHSRYLNRDPNQPPGPFASIVHDYCEMRDNVTGRNPDLITTGTAAHVPQKLTLQERIEIESDAIKRKSSNEHAQVLVEVMEAVAKNEKKKRKASMGQEEQKKNPFNKSRFKFDNGSDRKSLQTQTEETEQFEGWFSSHLQTNTLRELNPEAGNDKTREEQEQEMKVNASMLQKAVTQSEKQVASHAAQEIVEDIESTVAAPQRKSTLRRLRKPVNVRIVDFYDDEFGPEVQYGHVPPEGHPDIKKRSLDESDPGLMGTKVVSSKGQSYTEILKVGEKKKVAARNFPGRQGAYGYFEDDHVDTTAPVQDNDETTSGDVLRVNKYRWQSKRKPSQFEARSSQPHTGGGADNEEANARVQKTSRNSVVLDTGEEYYDDTGKLVFKTPLEVKGRTRNDK